MLPIKDRYYFGVPFFSKEHRLCLGATCVNTYDGTHVINSTVTPGAAADTAEDCKRRKYTTIIFQFGFEETEPGDNVPESPNDEDPIGRTFGSIITTFINL